MCPGHVIAVLLLNINNRREKPLDLLHSPEMILLSNSIIARDRYDDRYRQTLSNCGAWKFSW